MLSKETAVCMALLLEGRVPHFESGPGAARSSAYLRSLRAEGEAQGSYTQVQTYSWSQGSRQERGGDREKLGGGVEVRRRKPSPSWETYQRPLMPPVQAQGWKEFQVI